MAFSLAAQDTLRGPQKVVNDTEHYRYLVSNFNTGDIVLIDNTGKLDYFINSANFVDGLEIVGDVVYGVGNNRNIRGYNLTTKELVMDITLTGSSYYLSSITSDSSGHLYISCPYANIIYKLRISDEAYWIFAQNDGLNKPNGILLEKENDRIVVIGDSPGTSDIYGISMADSSVSILKTTSFDRPDGIVRDQNGSYYVGGYYLPGIYKIESDFSGEPELIFEGSHIVYPTYHKEHNSLLITYYANNDWGEIFLSPTSILTNEIDKGFVLSKNYPNPFTNLTTIKFELRSEAQTTLKIFDIVGKLVKKLINEKLQAGTYSVSWDGRDKSGNQVSNNIYFFRLTVNGITSIQKAILINN